MGAGNELSGQYNKKKKKLLNFQNPEHSVLKNGEKGKQWSKE